MSTVLDLGDEYPSLTYILIVTTNLLSKQKRVNMFTL